MPENKLDRVHQELVRKRQGHLNYLKWLESIRNPYMTADGRVVFNGEVLYTVTDNTQRMCY